MVPFDRYLALALAHFARRKVQVVVLETGIGGRLDSTNFVSAPDVCVVTRISLDHADMLGHRLQDIAWHKAGILKPGCPAFTPADQQPEVLRTLETEAREVGCPLVLVDAPTPAAEAAAEAAASAAECARGTQWQQQSRALAAAALEALGHRATDHAPGGPPWPCRFEEFAFRSPQRTVVLDGAHNIEGLTVLLAEVRQRRRRQPPHRSNGPLVAVFGVARDKEVSAMAAALAEGVDAVYPVEFTARSAVDAATVAVSSKPLKAG
ncbi:MAG: cyanophycin synthetase, partial [Pseudomonadota bacterium]